MSRELTSKGFIETTVVHHEIKVVKAIMTVEKWHELNNKVSIPVPKSHLACQRCNLLWCDLSMAGNVNLCTMKKGLNITICDNCLVQIDDNLKIK